MHYLPRDRHERHAAELRVGHACDQVGGTRAEGREADAGAAGEPAVRRRHEGRVLLVARGHELDRARAQCLHEVEGFLARGDDPPMPPSPPLYRAELDALPYPEFRDYFAQLAKASLALGPTTRSVSGYAVM